MASLCYMVLRWPSCGTGRAFQALLGEASIATVQVLITLCIRALPGEQPEPRCSVGPAGEAEEDALLCASSVSGKACVSPADVLAQC